MVLISFAVGVRCFLDFDRGLQHSKTQCKLLYTTHKKKKDTNRSWNVAGVSYSSSGNVSQKHDAAGVPLGRRVSIEWLFSLYAHLVRETWLETYRESDITFT